MPLLKKIISGNDTITLSDDTALDTLAIIINEHIGRDRTVVAAVMNIRQAQEFADVLNNWLRARYLRNSLKE